MSIPLHKAQFVKSADPLEHYNNMLRAINLRMKNNPPVNEKDSQEFIGNLVEAFEVLGLSAGQQTELLNVISLKCEEKGEKDSVLDTLTIEKILEITDATQGDLPLSAEFRGHTPVMH